MRCCQTHHQGTQQGGLAPARSAKDHRMTACQINSERKLLCLGRVVDQADGRPHCASPIDALPAPVAFYPVDRGRAEWEKWIGLTAEELRIKGELCRQRIGPGFLLRYNIIVLSRQTCR